jgi:hypothetical protein
MRGLILLEISQTIELRFRLTVIRDIASIQKRRECRKVPDYAGDLVGIVPIPRQKMLRKVRTSHMLVIMTYERLSCL